MVERPTPWASWHPVTSAIWDTLFSGPWLRQQVLSRIHLDLWGLSAASVSPPPPSLCRESLPITQVLLGHTWVSLVLGLSLTSTCPHTLLPSHTGSSSFIPRIMEGLKQSWAEPEGFGPSSLRDIFSFLHAPPLPILLSAQGTLGHSPWFPSSRLF